MSEKEEFKNLRWEKGLEVYKEFLNELKKCYENFLTQQSKKIDDFDKRLKKIENLLNLD